MHTFDNFVRIGVKWPKEVAVKSFPKGWPTFKKSVYNGESHYAVLTGAVNKILVIDIDVCKSTGESPGVEWFEELFGCLPETYPTLITSSPSGGYHIFFSVNSDKVKGGRIPQVLVDIQGDGSCVFQGESYPILVDHTLHPLTQTQLESINKAFSRDGGESLTEKALVVRKPSSSELQYVLDNLSISRTSDYSDWLHVGFVLSRELNGFELFKEFSKKCRDKYTESTIKEKWNSFKKPYEGKPLTKSSLYLWLKRDNPVAFKEVSHSYKKQIGREWMSQNINSTLKVSLDVNWICTPNQSGAVLHPEGYNECLVNRNTFHEQGTTSRVDVGNNGTVIISCQKECGVKSLTVREGKSFISILNKTEGNGKKTAYQKLSERLIDDGSTRNLRREKGTGTVYIPVRPWSYIVHQEADVYISETLEDTLNEPDGLNSHASMLDNLKKFMKSMWVREFPFLVRDQRYLGFRNGVLDKETLEFLPDGIPDDKVCWKYFDTDFTRSTDTPLMNKVLDHHFDEETREFIFACFGRLFGIRDKHGFMLYLVGNAGCGKSLVINVLKKCFDSIGSINQGFEQTFGLSALLTKDVVLADDLPKKLSKVLPQELFQSMVTGGELSSAVKNGAPVFRDWNVPVLFAGNYLPDYHDLGQVSRRVFVANFENNVYTQNPALEGLIVESELEAVVYKSLLRYNELLLGKRSSEKVWDFCPQYFRDEQDEVRRGLNPLYKFLSDRCVYKKGSKLKMSDIKDAFSLWLGRSVRDALEEGTFGQVNKEYIVEKINLCKACKKAHIKGCCEKYHRTDRTRYKVVTNIDFGLED